jgi:hypothetical protein
VKKSKFSLFYTTIILLIFTLVTACSQVTSAPDETPELSKTSTNIPATPTRVPPTMTTTETMAPPTITPTVTPPPDPVNLLLSTSDTNDYFVGMPTFTEGIENNNTYYEVFYFNASDCVRKLRNRITIASQPWAEIPSDVIEGGIPLEFPLIGDISEAFTLSAGFDTAVVFIKGRAMVTLITNCVDITTIEKYAHILESHLSVSIPGPLPISFTNTIDEALGTKIFKKLELSQDISEFDASRVTICLDLEYNEKIEYSGSFSFAFAIYNKQSNIIIYKRIPQYRPTSDSGSGNQSYCYFGSQPGNYEYWLSIDDVMIKSMPFEIK